MTIFRNIKDKRLYTIYLNKPPKYTGMWYVCVDFFTKKERKIKDSELKDFIKVSYK